MTVHQALSMHSIEYIFRVTVFILGEKLPNHRDGILIPLLIDKFLYFLYLLIVKVALLPEITMFGCFCWIFAITYLMIIYVYCPFLCRCCYPCSCCLLNDAWCSDSASISLSFSSGRGLLGSHQSRCSWYPSRSCLDGGWRFYEIRHYTLTLFVIDCIWINLLCLKNSKVTSFGFYDGTLPQLIGPHS